MSRAEFVVVFRGEAAAGGRIDVRDLAPALLSLGAAIDAANVALNGDRQPVKVEVHAVAEGSFEVYLDVVMSRWEQLKTLLHDSDVDSAKQLLEWLGILGGKAGVAVGAVGGLIGLYRWLNGKTPTKVERSKAGGVTIHDEAGHTITVPWEVLRLYQDLAVNRALGQLLDTLHNEALDSIELRDAKAITPPVTLTRADRAAFSLPQPEDETVVDDTRTLALSIRSLAFQEGNKWRLFDGQNVITATIEDRDFIMRVDRNQIRFAKGDVLLCQVRTVQKQTTDGLKTDHFVQKVVEHRTAQTQIPLPFDDEG